MKEERTEKGKLLLKDSPFMWREGQKLVCENTNRNCTHEQIEEMRNRGLVNIVDLAVLSILAKYRFLTLSHIHDSMNRDVLSNEYQKTSYARNVLKLVKAGLILRFCFTNAEQKTDFPQVTWRSVHFYDLSKGAYTYMRDVEKCTVHHMDYQQKPERVLELLSLNQFDLGMFFSAGTQVLYRGYVEKRRLAFTNIELDLYYKLKTGTPLPLHLYVASIRMSPDFSDRFCEKMRIIRSCIQVSGCTDSSVVLLVCENQEAIKRLFNCQQENEMLSNEVILYTTDISTYVFGAARSIMWCRKKENKILLEHFRMIGF